MPAIPEIDVDTLHEQLQGGATVIDVREAEEYSAGHVPGAILVPLSEFADRVDDIPDVSPLYVICRSGARSMRACEFLLTIDRTATNVGGGTMAWIDSGRDVVAGDERG